ETALTAYERVLAIEPGSDAALEGVRSLAGAEDPRFELRRLRIELPRANPERRVEIHLAAARLERGPLADPAAAIATLRTLIEETGPDGSGYEPLAALLRERGDFSALVDLIDLVEARAGRLADPAARV